MDFHNRFSALNNYFCCIVSEIFHGTFHDKMLRRRVVSTVSFSSAHITQLIEGKGMGGKEGRGQKPKGIFSSLGRRCCHHP